MRITQPRAGIRRRGHIAVFVAASMVAIVGTIAVSLDGGAIMSERRHAHSAADAAALAGACDLYYNFWAYSGKDTPGTAKLAALAAAKENGYVNDGTTTEVVVNIPPQSGFYVGRDGYCEVIVTYNHPRGFSNLFSTGTVPVKARAVAVGMPIAADVGILVLDPDNKDAFSVSAQIRVDDTPIIVNSTHIEGSIVNSGLAQAPEFDLTGGYAEIGGGEFVGDIYQNRPPTEDPFKYLPEPDPSAMVVRRNNKLQETQSTLNLLPGVYKGGINVSGVGSLNLAPGIYYMENGGFAFTGQGTLRGEGVLIYTNPGNGNSDGISVSGQGSVYLTGMTSGIYQGMTFWQARESTVTGSVSGTGAGTYIAGTFYFAGAHLAVSGNGGAVNLGSQYVSNTLAVTGNGIVDIQWDPFSVGRRRVITIVE